MGNKLQGSALLFLFIAVCVISGIPHYPVSLLTAVIVHEMGHLICAKLCRVKLNGIDFYPLGIRMRYSFTDVSSFREIIVYLGGSMAGLLTAFAVLYLGLDDSRAVMSFIITSNNLSIMNLLPVIGLDGGGIILTLLSHYLMPDTAYRVTRIISGCTVILFWIVTLRVEMRIGMNLSMLALSLYLIYSALL